MGASMRSPTRVALAVVAGLYLAITNFPQLPLIVQPGLDPGWIYGINQAKVQSLRFGSHFVYTYGPLGYLLYPLDLGSNLSRALGFGIALSVLAAALGFIGVLRAPSTLGALVFVCALTAALRAAAPLDPALGASGEYRIAFFVLLALCLTIDMRHHHPLALLATALAAATVLMKLSLGMACAGSLGMYLLLQRRRGQIRSWHVIAYAAGFALAVAALFTLTGNRLADLPDFLRYSLDLIAGQSDAMSLKGPFVEVLLGVGCLALATALAVQSPTRLRNRVLLALPILLVAYKHAFMRHDLHALNMFTVALGCFAVFALFADRSFEAAWIGAGLLLAMAAMTVVLGTRGQPTPSLTTLDPRPGLARMRAYGDWTTLHAATSGRSAQALRDYVLPLPLQQRLRSGMVDVVPFDTAYIAANHLRWAPQPVFQSHLAYTAALDRLNAAHFTGSNAPQYVLYELKGLDGRHPFLDNPATTRALLCNYVLDQREGDLLVLRRAAPRCGALLPAGERTIRWNEPITVPENADGVLVRLHIHYGLWGSLRRLLLRSPYVGLMMHYSDGSATSYRLLPAVAADGIWIDHLPRGTDAMEQLLSGSPPPAVRSFRVLSSKASWFEPEIGVEFVKLAPAPAFDAIRTATAGVDDARLRNAEREPANWLTHGGTYAEQRFSRLDRINAGNVGRLQLAWSFDLPTHEAIEATPVVVDGVLFTTAPWSIVFAIDARSGRALWRYDPHVPHEYGAKVCCGVINRGVAVYRGKVFVGTLDGRLVALDAVSGRPLWEVMTVDQSRPYTITGAPRVVDGKVIIGNGGADLGVRGYLSAYDAETGVLVWRVFTVPGDPSRPFESPALARAASTWRGEWWKLGGGGTVWDAMAYDPELDLLYVGTGNGGPWNRAIRSPGGGDNLFLSSILALRPRSGELVWHYQETPGDAWDYAATQQIILADLPIDGRIRKVLLHAPKNGFFYVIDRETGALLSARNYVDVTWASHVDPTTGRPAEIPGADYREHEFLLKPSTFGGHSWQPMSFNPNTGLVYVPAQEIAVTVAPDPDWSFRSSGLNTGTLLKPFPLSMATGHLLAWDPVRQREVWRAQYTRPWNGGTLTTAGNLVFQGTNDGRFLAYRADTGEPLWQAAAGPRIVAGPVTYLVDGEQYVSVLASRGGPFEIGYPAGAPAYGRMLTFSLSGISGPAAGASEQTRPAN
jgi:quinohemoprotein ethanol dehydrogenase